MEAMPVTSGAEQNGSVSKIKRGRPKVKQGVEEIQKLADGGLTTRQIADKLGMSHVTVSRRLKPQR